MYWLLGLVGCSTSPRLSLLNVDARRSCVSIARIERDVATVRVELRAKYAPDAVEAVARGERTGPRGPQTIGRYKDVTNEGGKSRRNGDVTEHES